MELIKKKIYQNLIKSKKKKKTKKKKKNKKKKRKILLYSWLPTGTTYHKNMAIWNFFSLKYGKSGPFFPRKSSVI